MLGRREGGETRTPVQLIEDHSEQITDRVIRRFRNDSELPQLNQFPVSELRDRALEVLKILGHWLAMRKWEELEHQVGHFFDNLVCHVVRGYEEAPRKAVRAAS